LGKINVFTINWESSVQRKYLQIRDIKLIEEGLTSSMVGVAAFHAEDKFIQYPTSYVYLDKNIYIMFRESEDFYDLIKYGSPASFNVLRQEKQKKTKTTSTNENRYLSFTIIGSIKKLDDPKQTDECLTTYYAKYTYEKVSKNLKKNSALSQIIMIDSEEIQAFEEIIF